ncbi:MAG TPA: hypothetical protein PKH40_09225 [Treponemataceae bacterium]|mgnify:CR=1 FL=1|nr:hypothetical protein [Treponemataceae bacterium]
MTKKTIVIVLLITCCGMVTFAGGKKDSSSPKSSPTTSQQNSSAATKSAVDYILGAATPAAAAKIVGPQLAGPAAIVATAAYGVATTASTYYTGESIGGHVTNAAIAGKNEADKAVENAARAAIPYANALINAATRGLWNEIPSYMK